MTEEAAALLHSVQLRIVYCCWLVTVCEGAYWVMWLGRASFEFCLLHHLCFGVGGSRGAVRPAAVEAETHGEKAREHDQRSRRAAPASHREKYLTLGGSHRTRVGAIPVLSSGAMAEHEDLHRAPQVAMLAVGSDPYTACSRQWYASGFKPSSSSCASTACTLLTLSRLWAVDHIATRLTHPRSVLRRGGVALSALLLTRGSHALCMTRDAAASAAEARASS